MEITCSTWSFLINGPWRKIVLIRRNGDVYTLTKSFSFLCRFTLWPGGTDEFNRSRWSFVDLFFFFRDHLLQKNRKQRWFIVVSVWYQVLLLDCRYHEQQMEKNQLNNHRRERCVSSEIFSLDDSALSVVLRHESDYSHVFHREVTDAIAKDKIQHRSDRKGKKSLLEVSDDIDRSTRIDVDPTNRSWSLRVATWDFHILDKIVYSFFVSF